MTAALSCHVQKVVVISSAGKENKDMKVLNNLNYVGEGFGEMGPEL